MNDFDPVDQDRPASTATVKHAAEIPSQSVDAGVATEVQVLLGEADGAPNFAMRRFCMGAGGGMPRHTNVVEHEQYVLGGRARIGIGDRVYEVGPHDVVLIPGSVPHWYEVTEAPFEFLCLVPNAPDEIRILPGS